MASRDSWYDQVLDCHKRWLLTRNQWNLGYKPAGYFDEAEGPDATYAGITCFNLACMLHERPDPELTGALRRCIDLFNHTIAPEPDGTRLGSSSFAHRTPGDWTTPQLGGGLIMLADDYPGAAAHVGHAWMAKPEPRTPAELQAVENDLIASLRFDDINIFRNPDRGPDVVGYGPGLYYRIWKNYPEHMLAGELPVKTDSAFTRDFGGEFLCVRRPSYYSFIYAGKPMGEWQKSRRPTEANRQHPRNGGGLCMFWSPSMGSSILGKNWSASAAHTLLAERSNPARTDWEDYWSIQSSFDGDSNRATIEGGLRDLPLRFEKRYRFLDDRIECETTVYAEQAVTLDRLSECFPYPLDKPQPLQVEFLDDHGRPVAKKPASAIAFRNASAEAHLIIFHQPRSCDDGIDQSADTYNQPRKHGRVLANWPSQWTAGQQRTLRWTLLTCPTDRIVETVRSVLNRQ